MVILSRALNREVGVIMLAACVVLLLVSLASQFRIYIEAVARGALEPGSVAPIMFNLMPQFLGLILPIAFYIGLVVGLVRWHKDNELISLHTAGMGQMRFSLALIPLTLGVTILCAALQFYITPAGVERAAAISAANKTLDAFDLITPKQFTPLAQKMQIYAEEINEQKRMKNIFVYGFDDNTVLAVLSQGADLTEQRENRFFRLSDGFAYNLDPSTNELVKFQFVSADIDISPEIPRISINNLDALPTALLMASNDPRYQSLLWWRISLVLLVPVLFFSVVITQQVTPRRTAGLRLLSVFLLCVGYIGLLYAARTLADDGAPAPLVYGATHLLVLSLVYSWYRRYRN